MKNIQLLIIILLCSVSLWAQNVVFNNVSVNPNPFSPNNDGQKDDTNISFYLYYPATVLNPQYKLKIFQNSDTTNVVFNTLISANNGLNQFTWDGKDNFNVLLPDNKYGFKIEFYQAGYQAEYVSLNGIIIKTIAPDIEMVSAFPNPFSPNGDGYQDVQTLKYKVKNAEVYYLGTLKINLSDTTAVYVDGPNPIPHSEGAYIFVNRPIFYNGLVNISSNAEYDLRIGNNAVRVNLGNSLYKFGTTYDRYYSIGSNVAMTPTDLFTGTDYLAVYAVSGNMSLNVFNNDGTEIALTDLYNNYYGSFYDNPIDPSLIDASIGKTYAVNIGTDEGQIPGTTLDDGRYIYRMTISNEVETDNQLSGEFLVNNNPVMVTGNATPNKISPQKVDGVFDQSVIQYTPTEDAYVTVKIWDASNQLIKTIIQNQLSIANIGNYVLWDGKDNNGNTVSLNSEAQYRIEITATDRYINSDVTSLNIPILVDNLAPISSILYQTEPDSVNTSIMSVSGLSDQINSEIILYQNGIEKGVVGTTPSFPGYFQFNVTLEEGNNSISVKLRDSVYNLGSSSNSINFYLDSQTPVITSITPESNSSFTSLPINVSALVTDNGVGVKQVRFGFSFNESTNLSWVTATIDPLNVNLYKAEVPISSSVSQLSVSMLVQATDNMNNTIQSINPVSFNYTRPSSTNPPVFSSSYPLNNANLKQINANTFKIVINSENPLITNPDSTYIKLYNQSSNDSLYNAFGATLSYSVTQNQYTLNLELENPLSLNGDLDANYKMKYRAVNQVGQKIEGFVFFNYDTTKPVIQNISFNNNQSILNANNRNYFTSNIASLTMQVADNLSGINFAQNLSSLTIQDSNNNLLSGIRSIDELNKTITWTLTNPILISGAQDYTILANVNDNALNNRSESYTFTLLSPQAPQISYHVPINQAIIKNLNANQITKTLSDINGFGLDNNLSQISLSGANNTYSDGQNAVKSLVQNLDGSYTMKLTLNDALASDGSVDGVYTVTTQVTDLLNQSANSTTNFTYDTKAPVFANAKIGNDDPNNVWTQSLINNMTLNQLVKYVKIDVSDPTSGVNASSNNTYIKMYKANGELVSGNLAYNAGTLTWSLVNALPQDISQNGAYYILYSALDNAQNTINGRIDFNLQDNSFEPLPIFASSVPSNNQNVNLLSSNQIKVNIQSSYPISQDSNDSYLTLTHVSTGNVIENGSGAVLSYQVANDLTTMILTLSRALYVDGTDDGLYRINYTAKSSLNQVISDSILFNYDTTKPVISQVNINAGSLNQAGDRFYFSSNINAVSMTLSDNLSGINYASNLTKIVLYDAQNNLISGSRSVSGNKISWTLTNPITISSPVDLTLAFLVTDNAGNIKTENKVFTLLTPSDPIFIQHTPLNNSNLNILNQNQIVKTINDINGFGLDNNLSQISLSGANNTYSDGQNAVKSLVQNLDGSYTMKLTLNDALASDGSVDGVYTVTTQVTDLLNQSANSTITFTYDTQGPVFANAKIGGSDNNIPWQLSLVNQMSINHSISYVSVDVSDLIGSINSSSNNTYIKLYKANGTLVNGSFTYLNGLMTWTLNQTLPQSIADNGAYYISYNAPDNAGNVSNGRIDFNLQNTGYIPIPLLISSYPLENQNVKNLASNQISVVIQSEFPLDMDSSFVKLQHVPSSSIIEDNNGASFAVQTNNSLYTMLLTLNSPLQDNGADDAHYKIIYKAKNTLAQTITDSIDFVYDTSKPVLSALNINNSFLQEINNINYFASRIDSVSVYLSDNLSGIDYSANMSRLTLHNHFNQIVNGIRKIDQNTGRISWMLTTPILLNESNLGTYSIVLSTTDKAGNNYSMTTQFSLINPTSPQISEHIPAENAYIRSLVNNRISKKVLDRNTFGLDRSNSSIVLQGPNGTFQNGDNAQMSFTSIQNNLYNVYLNLDNALETDGSDDGIYHVNTTIVDTLGQSAHHLMDFTYDTQAPLVSNPSIGGLSNNVPWASSLTNNTTYNQSVSYVSINLSDISTQVNFSSSNTFIRIYRSNNQVLSGTQSIQGNVLKWTLNNPILNDGSMDVAYYVTYSAVDMAGNQINSRIDFRVINPSAPQITQVFPENGSIINNLSTNIIYVDFHDQRPIDLQDFTNTYIKLSAPDNSIIQHNQNATQLIHDLGQNNYRVELTLNPALTLNGQYTVQCRIQNTQLYNVSQTTYFVFDNQLPLVQSVRLGLVNGSEITVMNNDQVYHGISYLKVLLNDQTSGVNYTSDSTNVFISSNNQIIPGSLIKDEAENYLKYIFASPISELGMNISVAINALDYAHNYNTAQLGFELNALQANIISIYPENNAYINTSLNQVRLVVEYAQNISLNENLSYIRLRHPDGSYIEPGQGGNLSITNLTPTQFEITFNLNQPLLENGQDDGEYQIYALLTTDLFQEGPIHFSFTYDRLTPYYQNLKINEMVIVGNTLTQAKKGIKSKKGKTRNELIFSQPITQIQADFADITSDVNFTSNLTTITLLNPAGLLVQGNRIIENNTVKWVLNSPLPVDGTKDGVYTISLKATDYAGNILNTSYQFQLMSHIIPELLAYSPTAVLNHYTNSFEPANISATFKNIIPVVQNPSSTYITMTFPNGNIASHNQGALLSYDNTSGNMVTNFHLIGSLSTNGENDGTYQVRMHASNSYGAEFDTTMSFIYDSLLPSYSQIKALTPDNTLIPITSETIITQSISSVQVKLSDLTSGVNYSPNISFISILDRNNNLLPGVLSYIESSEGTITKWNLVNAIPTDGSADGLYHIKLKITDKSGNSLDKEIPFNVISVLPPVNVVTYLDAVYNVHISWNSPVVAKKVINNRSIGNYQVYRKYADQEFVLIAQTQSLNYMDNLQQLPDGVYQYMVKALYTISGSSQQLLSNPANAIPFTIHRFVPCTFNLRLSDNLEPSDIHFHLLGNDGIYNQEYNLTSDANGQIALTNVFNDDYIISLSKEGYETIIDTISIGVNTPEFTYVLETIHPVLNGQPEAYVLYQNFPNPFNPTTEIRFALKNKSKVDLSIYNIKGQKITQLVDTNMEMGYHKSIWNGLDAYGKRVSSGMYFCVINVKNDKESYRNVKKMLMMK